MHGESGCSAHEDLELVRRALDGDEVACEVILRQVVPRVEASVQRLCSDASGRQRASDLVSELISDCFGASKRPRGEDVLLRYYDGRASLASWLSTVAISRLRNWWKSGRHRFEVSEGDSAHPIEQKGDPITAESASISEVADLLAAALAWAFEHAPRREMVWLRLIHLHEIPQHVVATIWGVHASGVSRGLSECLNQVRKNALAYLRRVDPYLEVEWGDCVSLCGRVTGLVSGAAGVSYDI